MNKFIKIGFLALLSSFATLQAAEFESNVDMSSDYVWRGMTQTSEEPAISGGFDIAGENGLYFWTWASNVEFGDGDVLEMYLSKPFRVGDKFKITTMLPDIDASLDNINLSDNKSELKLYRKSSLTNKNNIFSKMNINNEKHKWII